MAVKERARREKRSAGHILSELARQSLTRGGSPDTGKKRSSFRGIQPLPHRGRPVTNSLIDQLREAEAE